MVFQKIHIQITSHILSRNFLRLRCHNAIQLGILRESVHKGQDHVAIEQQSLALAGVGDVGELVGADVNVIKLRKRTLNVILSALSSGTISLFVIVRLNNFYFVYQTIKLTSEIKRDILLSKGLGAMKISVGMS